MVRPGVMLPSFSRQARCKLDTRARPTTTAQICHFQLSSLCMSRSGRDRLDLVDSLAITMMTEHGWNVSTER
jgi:hypothetical protein